MDRETWEGWIIAAAEALEADKTPEWLVRSETLGGLKIAGFRSPGPTLITLLEQNPNTYSIYASVVRRTKVKLFWIMLPGKNKNDFHVHTGNMVIKYGNYPWKVLSTAKAKPKIEAILRLLDEEEGRV